jgi:hypothetical protein
MTANVGASILIGMLQTGVAGRVPTGLGPLEAPGRVLWLPASPSRDEEKRECTLTAASRWACPSVPVGERGVTIILGDGVIGYVVVGPTGTAVSGMAEWGRLVRVASATESPGDLRMSSWTVDRPAGRPNTLKLDVVRDATLQVVKISDTAFWVSGSRPSPDAFFRLEGPDIGRHDALALTLAETPADSPFVLDATAAVSISGRVEARSGQPVEGALLELFARAPGAGDGAGDERALAKMPVIRLATAIADGEGRFEFSGLEHGTYQVVATSFSHGRLARWTSTASPPLLMTLQAPATATGRVVRQKLPAPDVKVRFVPATAAWRNSTDPSAHLTADVSTDDAGRFTLVLPPEPSGDVQFIAPDGASMRIALPSLPNLTEIPLGDVAMPERIAVEIRADVAGCRMSAIGPAGALGLAVVTGRATSTIYHFDLPESGQWFLDAECSGRHASIQPPAIRVRSSRSLPSFDVHVVVAGTAGSPR